MRLAILAAALLLVVASSQAAVFDITAYGAKPDGKTQNRDAINKAIDAASATGGGIVEFGPGVWVTGSIHLRSNVTLHLERGAIIEASADASTYDAPEPNQWDKFQDAGHSHFHNSLIWGENLDNIAITGGGRISGNALNRGGGAGGDKAIALKLCRNVTLRDFSISLAGHFGVLATGVDNLTIDNVTMDLNRDGIDIDSCRNVRISNCSINAPNDDAITLKGTHALGAARVSENITITNCLVSGFEIGSLLDGTYKRTVKQAPDRDGPTGRIKIGTESEGDFRNITISNCVFDTSRGLALESVDGSHIEDVSVSNITMRNVSNAPIFLRLGSRLRAPEGTEIGSIRRIRISNITAYNADPRYGSIVSGIPGHDIEDVTISGVRLVYRGGLSLDTVAKQPAPAMFGVLPAYGFFIRHAKGIELNDVSVSYIQEDRRPAFVIDSAEHVTLENCQAARATGAPGLVMMKSKSILVRNCEGLTDFRGDSPGRKEM